MVFVPVAHINLAHEFYAPLKTSPVGVPETSQAQRSAAVRTSATTAEYEPSDRITPVMRKPQEGRTYTRKEKRDIVTARLRGGLVQYMVSMGYAMDVAVREVDRYVRQTSNMAANENRPSDESGSRQVFLSKMPPLTMGPRKGGKYAVQVRHAQLQASLSAPVNVIDFIA